MSLLLLPIDQKVDWELNFTLAQKPANLNSTVLVLCCGKLLFSLLLTCSWSVSMTQLQAIRPDGQTSVVQSWHWFLGPWKLYSIQTLFLGRYGDSPDRKAQEERHRLWWRVCHSNEDHLCPKGRKKLVWLVVCQADWMQLVTGWQLKPQKPCITRVLLMPNMLTITLMKHEPSTDMSVKRATNFEAFKKGTVITTRFVCGLHQRFNAQTKLLSWML